MKYPFKPGDKIKRKEEYPNAKAPPDKIFTVYDCLLGPKEDKFLLKIEELLLDAKNDSVWYAERFDLVTISSPISSTDIEVAEDEKLKTTLKENVRMLDI